MVFAPLRTLRGRLLLLALLVEAVMLGILITNSLRLVRDNMGEQAKSHAEQIAPVLLAALVAPMAQYDYATVQAVLDESQAVKGIEYAAVTDRSGQVTAISGWPAGKPLPPPDAVFSIDKSDGPPRYDVARPIVLAGQQLGTLHFGLDLSRIVEARDSLLLQGFLIAGGELILSACLLTALGLLITRQLYILTRASAEVASGGTAPKVPEGDDDIGRLGAAFNAMSRAIAERVGQLILARDERTAMADKLEHEHARLEALLAAMKFGILLSDRGGKVVYANDAVYAQWRLDPRRYPRGGALHDFFDGMSAALPNPSCFLEPPVGSPPEAQEAVLKDGRVFTLHCHQVVGADGGVLGNLWLFADVTDSRRFERQLMDAKERAEAANVAKSRFLATMSHEIRTPMNGILGMAQLLLMSELSDQERQDYARTILNSGQTLLILLNDILDLSKIEAGKLELSPVSFDPRQLVGEIAALFAAPAHAKGLTIDSVWNGPAGGRYRADAIRVRQMLSNLVSNAIKFTDHGFVRV
ncbi:MAG TPA: histidine kinase dimerization/phospho-acceptor domain-containing protein, partial [Rhodocyclaceae bacterium]|nr:histidine kinase dimerization/phospho-acceptor domain-containing protein [Rhodocyclaceae bacterium]